MKLACIELVREWSIRTAHLKDTRIKNREKEVLMVTERWRPTLMRPRRLFRDFDSLEHLLEQPLHLSWNRLPAEHMAWAALVDMYEKEDKFVVRAELPGVKKEDIDISLSGDTLFIEGERKPPEDVKSGEYKCSEVCYGSFSRSVTMPSAVDDSKIEASYEDGILEISLPKAKEAKTAKIEIKAK